LCIICLYRSTPSDTGKCHGILMNSYGTAASDHCSPRWIPSYQRFPWWSRNLFFLPTKSYLNHFYWAKELTRSLSWQLSACSLCRWRSHSNQSSHPWLIFCLQSFLCVLDDQWDIQYWRYHQVRNPAQSCLVCWV